MVAGTAVGGHRRRVVQRLAELRRHLRRQQDHRGLAREHVARRCPATRRSYFRTAPPDSVQGNALGTLISQDGYTNIGFLVFNDTYGTGLRNASRRPSRPAGGKCVYGCKGDGDEFPAGQTTFSAEVQAVTAAKPDAIVVLAFDETKSIVPELAASGFDMSKTYFVRRQHRRLQRGLRARHPRGRSGHDPRPGPRPGLQGPAGGLVPARPRARTSRTSPTAPSPTTPPSSPRSPRRRAARTTRSRCRRTSPPSRVPPTARSAPPTPTAWHCSRAAGDPLRRSFGHRSDRRRERPVLGVRRHLPVRRQQQERPERHGRGLQAVVD